MKKVQIIVAVILALYAIHFMVKAASIPRPLPVTEIGFALDGGTWVSIYLDEDRETRRRVFEEAFVVTEEGDFRWLKMEVRLNGELAGEEAEAEVKIMTNGTWEYPSPGVHDLRMGDSILIENIGRPIRDKDRLEVLYENDILAGTSVVILPKD